MTAQEAIKILHPESSFEALLGCTREEGLKIVEEACLIACEALKKQAGVEKALERLEERHKNHEKMLKHYRQIKDLDSAVKQSKMKCENEIAIEIIKEEVGYDDHGRADAN